MTTAAPHARTAIVIAAAAVAWAVTAVIVIVPAPPARAAVIVIPPVIVTPALSAPAVIGRALKRLLDPIAPVMSRGCIRSSAKSSKTGHQNGGNQQCAFHLVSP
jgi:hypothetical protein